MKRLVSLLALLAMTAFAPPPAAAGGPHAFQKRIAKTLAAFPSCGVLNEGDLVIVTDASTNADCDTTPEANPLNWTPALCICDGGTRRAVYSATDPSSYVPVTKAGTIAISTTGDGNDFNVTSADDIKLTSKDYTTLELADASHLFALTAAGFSVGTPNGMHELGGSNASGIYVVGQTRLVPQSAPTFACSGGTEGARYFDSDIHKECVCNGTAYVLANDDTTTTGCS